MHKTCWCQTVQSLPFNIAHVGDFWTNFYAGCGWIRWSLFPELVLLSHRDWWCVCSVTSYCALVWIKCSFISNRCEFKQYRPPIFSREQWRALPKQSPLLLWPQHHLQNRHKINSEQQLWKWITFQELPWPYYPPPSITNWSFLGANTDHPDSEVEIGTGVLPVPKARHVGYLESQFWYPVETSE